MAEYTMELREIFELEGDNTDIGLSDYPIFEADYRAALNEKIIRHFFTREIGVETISMFKYQLRRKMHEIMPYWNQHYKASQIQFDPLKTVSMKTVSGTEGESTVVGEGDSTSSTNSKSRAVASNLPQVMLSGNGDYAESAQDNISETTATGGNNETQTTNSNGTVDTDTNGYQGSAAILIAEYRATLVNTDMDVINQLEPLFMGIWGSTDSFFEGGFPHYGHIGYFGISG